MRSKDFKAGDLTWIGVRAAWDTGWVQTGGAASFPERVDLVAGAPATILRRAHADDYGFYGSYTQPWNNGISVGSRLADESWLTLYNGQPVMIRESYLNKRRYKPRKKPQDGDEGAGRSHVELTQQV